MSRHNDPELRREITEHADLPLFAEQSFTKFEQQTSGLSSTGLWAAQCETGAVPRNAAPDVARARRDDPATSKAAARSVVNLGRTKDRILSILRSQGVMTDEELVDYFARFVDFKVSPSGIRSRRAWLVDNGFVQVAGVGTTKAGRNCNTWRLTPMGEQK